jgi:hypothetical protein
VVKPTKVANNNAAEARITVPQTLPDSRATVEKRAVAKAIVSPTIANRKRTQTFDNPKRGKRRSAAGCGPFIICSG